MIMFYDRLQPPKYWEVTVINKGFSITWVPNEFILILSLKVFLATYYIGMNTELNEK